MARKKTTTLSPEKEQELEGKETIFTEMVAASVFNITMQKTEQRLTKQGTQYDKVDLVLAIDGGAPAYIVRAVAYNHTLYSVTVLRFDDGEKIYASPKSSITDTTAWLLADAKVAPGLATELKKMIITERRLALAGLATEQPKTE